MRTSIRVVYAAMTVVNLLRNLSLLFVTVSG